jgi:HPt (histidine-containing phosphotransfer) domain-containing protein
MTDDAPDEALAGALAAIWTRHRELMFTRLTAIESALSAAAAGNLGEEERAAAQRDAHKLAGALGTFGLHEGTTHARHIELALAAAGALDVEDLNSAASGLRAALESRP